MRSHAQLASLTSTAPLQSRHHHGFFGRLFPDLPAWQPPFQQGRQTTDEQADQFFKDIARTMIEPDGQNFDSKLPAGYTYFGQFIDHDITFDPASSLVRQNDPNLLHNFRTPRLDLDNVYLRGPDASPHLYERDKHDQPMGRFLISSGDNNNEPDLPRNLIGTALIGDPRNDENVIVSQLQLAFLRFHNRLFDMKLDALGDTKRAFDEARRLVTWTYQYIVWHDFVKRIINDDLWGKVLTQTPKSGKRWALNTRFYDWRNTPFMPVEFSAAAYRFGHSLVRNAYQLNQKHTPVKGSEVNGVKLQKDVTIPIFNAADSKADLRGGRKLKENHSVQWDWFVDLPTSFDGIFPQKSHKIDPFLSDTLANIPAGPGGSNPLAFLNLKRGWRMGLPSGPTVAKHLGIDPIPTDPKEEALWFYILKEASAIPGAKNGNMLGQVGSTIVGEVFAGLLYGDPNSFINIEPEWTPSSEKFLKDNKVDNLNDDWELRDIIRLAQMPEEAAQIDSLVNTGSFKPSE